MQVLEIDPLAQRISSMHAWQEQTADRLNRIEEKQVNEAKALVAVTERVTELEGSFTIIGQVQKEMKDTNDHMAQVTRYLKRDISSHIVLHVEYPCVQRIFDHFARHQQF